MIHRKWMLACVLIMALVTSCDDNKEAEHGAAVKFNTPWSCEEHWMVASTVKDLSALAKLAGGDVSDSETKPGKSARDYQIGDVKIIMAPSCWDLASYRSLLAAWKPVAATDPDAGPDLLKELLNPTATNLQKANDAVSRRLRKASGDPQVHEEAAFLLGVFGMRENAREFGDLRSTLCQMTAHLALADQLRGDNKASLTGNWAHVLYHFHAGRPIKARELAADLSREGDSGRWKRVVELLITGDWRQMHDLGDLSLAEAMIQARALKEHWGNPQMMEFVGKNKALQATPEWSRLLAGSGKSVDEGHLAMRSALAMEFMEISEIFPTGKNPKPDRLAKSLAITGPVKGEDVSRVLSDADWAAYFRRHFFVICSDVSRFAIQSWDSHEAAVEWENYVLPYCRVLPGHELIEPLVATENTDFQKDLRATAAYILKHPEQVQVGLWCDYRFPTLDVGAETTMPAQEPWFREASPPGTAHDPERRSRYSGIYSGWTKHILALHAIDPWNSTLCFEVAENTGNNASSVKKAWGNLCEYSVRPLRQILKSPSLAAEERIATLRRLTEFDADEGFQLGEMLVMTGKPDEAIQAFEKAFTDAPDRVAAANQTQWMIYHYKLTGNDAKAREVADHNAKVFSYAGLVSALTLAVVEKDSARAMKLAHDIEERYGDSNAVAIATWDGGKNEKLRREVFPDGINSVTLADFPEGSRDKGPIIADTSPILTMAGLRAGDVILAVDGKRVENYMQYLMLLAAELDPKTHFIYRRGNKIAEVNCLLPGRRLVCGMR